MFVAVLACCWPGTAFGEEPSGISNAILYTPQETELSLEHTTRLIAEDADPTRIDCKIVLSERPPQDIVMHMEDIARQIRDDIAAEAVTALGREIPVEVDTAYEDIGARFISRGYTLNSSTPISGGGRTVRLDLYKRIGYATGSDYGEARATIRLRSQPKPDAYERIFLHLSATPAQVRTRNVPDGANQEVLRVKIARLKPQVEAEAGKIIGALDHPITLTPEERARVLQGATTIDRTLPFTWFGDGKQFPFSTNTRLGSRIIIDTPGQL